MPRCRICRKFNCSTQHRTGTRTARQRRKGRGGRATFTYSLSARSDTRLPVNASFYDASVTVAAGERVA